MTKFLKLHYKGKPALVDIASLSATVPAIKNNKPTNLTDIIVNGEVLFTADEAPEEIENAEVITLGEEKETVVPKGEAAATEQADPGQAPEEAET